MHIHVHVHIYVQLSHMYMYMCTCIAYISLMTIRTQMNIQSFTWYLYFDVHSIRFNLREAINNLKSKIFLGERMPIPSSPYECFLQYPAMIRYHGALILVCTSLSN